MGEVWLARDQRLERLVAVKLLPEGRSLDLAARGRMLREARAASALKHPSIVTIHDIGDHDGRAYIVMEYVEGETFDELVKRRGRLPPGEAVELVGQVADAVAVAHAAGILHRDLKAQNLMIDPAGRVKVLDFGLSKRTDGGGGSVLPELAVTESMPIVRSSGPADDDAVAPTIAPASVDATTPAPSIGSSAGRTDEPQTVVGSRMGTPGWAPPELIDGLPSDVRSDVFSLGVVLYHLLCGRLPFPGTTWAELHEQIDRGAPPPSTIAPEVKPALDRVVLAALDPDPARRPDTARELIDRARAAIAPGRPRAPLLAFGASGLLVAAAIVYMATRSDPSGPDEAAQVAPDAAPAPLPAPVAITALGGCAYSPIFLDDDTIAFDLTRDGTVDLYTVDLGAVPVRRTDAPDWEWRSARGATDREIIFLEEGQDHGYVTRYDLDTGKSTRLFATAGAAVLAGDAYFHAPAPGQVLRRRHENRDEPFLTLEAGSGIDTIAVSHDGTMLALLTFGANQIAKLCVTPTDRPEVRCFDAVTGSARPAWSSRGDAVYVHGKGDIARVAIADGAVTSVVPRTVATGGLAVAPSGARLVYSDCTTRTELTDVTAGALGAPIVDEPEARGPVYGPGGRLAYAAKTYNEQRVMVRDPDGTLREVFRYEDARVTGLAFSPDGTELAYALGSHTEPGIYVARLDSNAAPNRLTEENADHVPLFVEDGLVFTRNDANGTPRLMRVSRDGSKLEAASSRPRHALAADHTRGRILLGSPGGEHSYWWDPATGVETPGPVLPETTEHVQISPDGTWLLAQAGANGTTTLRMRLDGPAKLETILTLPGDLTSGTGAIDDDGRVVITVFRWTGELWTIEAPPGRPW